jgi:hypothetical protein
VARDDRIKAVSQAHTDKVAARARGLELAQGNSIYCLDATYRSLPTALRRLSNALEADSRTIVAYGATAPLGYWDAAAHQAEFNSESLDVLALLEE